MLRAPDDDLRARLDALAQHMKRHFAEEDEAMRNGAYNAGGYHLQEHAAVLKSLDEVRVALREGRSAVVRAFAEALADWFSEHERVMDLGLRGGWFNSGWAARRPSFDTAPEPSRIKATELNDGSARASRSQRPLRAG